MMRLLGILSLLFSNNYNNNDGIVGVSSLTFHVSYARIGRIGLGHWKLMQSNLPSTSSSCLQTSKGDKSYSFVEGSEYNDKVDEVMVS